MNDETPSGKTLTVPVEMVDDSINEAVGLSDRLAAKTEQVDQLIATVKQLQRKVETQCRPSKAEAITLASSVIDAWIKRRSIALHRDARTYLIDDLVGAFAATEVKDPMGVS